MICMLLSLRWAWVSPQSDKSLQGIWKDTGFLMTYHLTPAKKFEHHIYTYKLVLNLWNLHCWQAVVKRCLPQHFTILLFQNSEDSCHPKSMRKDRRGKLVPSLTSSLNKQNDSQVRLALTSLFTTKHVHVCCHSTVIIMAMFGHHWCHHTWHIS